MSKVNIFQNDRGFTLLEMTIVLMIVAVVTSISVGNFRGAQEAINRNEFIFQLKQDLHYAQQKAISHSATTTVIFLNSGKEYVVRQSGEIILRRKFHDNITFVPITLTLSDIAFLPDGNARKSGTLLIRIGDYSYRLVLLLGRGRFYIEQL
ncbi:hypothetical protein BKP45_09430 [Anaerobacillus alkalidiazotrophicus]|uniref:General secretion pathway GspH domain-containing protein n=1 Tax=Anaerobacillus alkalidiazotrophicus TaxID=472963 RepID=A0A1S2M8X2_9BACI|nr:competence type IV pilus minor pilin ComGD [Anaerobacillus alkalidiazotrophicus]OIJ20277.1 hypothetical protein BKP45_09430 [Anaerobacillus alkalidiazotrophicus]